MAWFKVDDKLHSHKKAARAGIAAMGLWTVAGSWCSDHLTDGFVPDYIAERLAPGEAEQLADRLVAAGFWTKDVHDGDDGWRFNDWDDYQPTRDDVEHKRAKERDKKRQQRRGPTGQYEASPRESHGDKAGSPVGSPEGVPPSRPDPTRPEPNKSERRQRRAPEIQLPEGWEPTPDHHQLAKDQGVNCLHEAAKFRDHAAANDRRQRDWDASFRTWLRRSRDYGAAGQNRAPPDNRHRQPEVGSAEWEAREQEAREFENRILGGAA